MESFKIITVLALIIGIFIPNINAQENYFLQKNLTNKNNVAENFIIKEIERGIAESNVDAISKYFSLQPYLSFSSGVNGYYSSSQAFYLLEEFFKSFRVVSFKFEHSKVEKTISYATGSYLYDKKGKRDIAKVYVILNKFGNNWFITQISIN
jgi:hypothetical protein